ARWPPCLVRGLVNAESAAPPRRGSLREESATSTAAQPPGDSGGKLRGRAGQSAGGTILEKLPRKGWNCWRRRGNSLLPDAASHGAMPVFRTPQQESRT